MLLTKQNAHGENSVSFLPSHFSVTYLIKIYYWFTNNWSIWIWSTCRNFHLASLLLLCSFTFKSELFWSRRVQCFMGVVMGLDLNIFEFGLEIWKVHKKQGLWGLKIKNPDAVQNSVGSSHLYIVWGLSVQKVNSRLS